MKKLVGKIDFKFDSPGQSQDTMNSGHIEFGLIQNSCMLSKFMHVERGTCSLE